MVSLLLIAKSNKFLLLRRSSGEHSYAGCWGLPGGSVEKNETPTDAIIREVKEETGLEIPNMRFLNKYSYHKTSMHVYVYNSSEFNPNEIVLNEEHTEWGMFNYHELYQMKDVIPSTVRFIGDYLSNTGL